MNSNLKVTILTAGAFIAGYALGSFFGVTDAGKNNGSGDITKVSVFHKNAVGSQVNAFEERLRSDTLAFKEESAMVELVNSRVNKFAELVDLSIEAASDKSEFNEVVNAFNNVKNLSENAVQVGKVASASLESLTSGERIDLATGYEQASQNLVVAYLMVNHQVQLGEQFVDAADKFFDGKSVEEAPEVAVVRDLWAQYCAENAYLNGDKRELAYWERQDRLCNQEFLANNIQLNLFNNLNFADGVFLYNSIPQMVNTSEVILKWGIDMLSSKNWNQFGSEINDRDSQYKRIKSVAVPAKK